MKGFILMIKLLLCQLKRNSKNVTTQHIQTSPMKQSNRYCIITDSNAGNYGALTTDFVAFPQPVMNKREKTLSVFPVLGSLGLNTVYFLVSVSVQLI